MRKNKLIPYLFFTTDHCYSGIRAITTKRYFFYPQLCILCDRVAARHSVSAHLYAILCTTKNHCFFLMKTSPLSFSKVLNVRRRQLICLSSVIQLERRNYKFTTWRNFSLNRNVTDKLNKSEHLKRGVKERRFNWTSFSSVFFVAVA